MTAYMERTHLDDLRDEARDARDEAIRRALPHHPDCRCRQCVWDEAAGEEPCGYVAPRKPPQDYCERPRPCTVHGPKEAA